LQQGGDREVGGLADSTLENRSALQFACALHEPVRSQAERLGHADTDPRGDRRGQQQQPEHACPDRTEHAGVAQLGDRGQDRDEHQRRDDHLQQPHVAAAHHRHPRERVEDGSAAETVDGLGRDAEQHAKQQRQQDVGRQRGAPP
jgi:hypothetical protein